MGSLKSRTQLELEVKHTRGLRAFWSFLQQDCWVISKSTSVGERSRAGESHTAFSDLASQVQQHHFCRVMWVTGESSRPSDSRGEKWTPALNGGGGGGGGRAHSRKSRWDGMGWLSEDSLRSAIDSSKGDWSSFATEKFEVPLGLWR